MKIYLAADYARKQEMQGCRYVIEALGHEVVSTWIDNQDEIEQMGIGGRPISNENVQEGSTYALTDYSDLYQCDLFVLFTTGNPSRGGRHTELGIALALGKQVAIVGPRENVFQCHPSVTQFESWSTFVAQVSKDWLIRHSI